jgi:hypothetical protein
MSNAEETSWFDEATAAIGQAVDATVDTAQQTYEYAADTAQQTYEYAADTAQQTYEYAADTAQQTYEYAADTAQQTYEYAADTAQQTYEYFATDGVEAAVTLPSNGPGLGSAVHSLRVIEDAMDTDDDGSLLDEVAGNWIKDVPIVGNILGEAGEDFGDFLTDMQGTRKSGLFSAHGTYDPNTSDSDYRPDSEFLRQRAGYGMWVNDSLGIGEQDASEVLLGMGSFPNNHAGSASVGGPAIILGAVGEWVEEEDDPFVPGDQSNTYHDYDNGGASTAS